MELSEYTFESLRNDGEFIVYRGTHRRQTDASPPSILVMTPVSERPALESLRKMGHEYSLRAELDPGWAVPPLALAPHQGRTMLVLTDPGGEPLDRLLGRPMELTQFLRLAVGVSAALGQLHGCGLVHKDVKPANILVNRASGEARLMGFGIASRLPRERQAPAPPEFIAGTLAYMAPEQTGRMNRSIDSRSDLYALGVTLYEMLTASLPFTASEPMEWVHCHIARQPMLPGEHVKNVPGSVSAIIMKLLAKTAEERYQTAAGAERDFRRCLAEWESLRRVDPFPLGAHDASDRLLIPEKLYGREAEIETLLAAFDRVVTQGTSELVLVSGYAGIGKSSLVNELHKVLVPPRGLFASGKFDQYKRDIPYATLAQAFQSLVRQLLSKSDAELGRWRDALHTALGPNGQLMVTLIPELELVTGKQPPVPDLPPQEAQSRFETVFRRFLGVFARSEHPLALFLDDLQWLDAATLRLLEQLITEPDVRHVVLIGAYRDNEVAPSHPLTRTLKSIRNAGANVQQIVLTPLELANVVQLVVDSLHCGQEQAQPLAQLIYEKTGGNPFFAIQFITALAEERLLAFNSEAAAWNWDLTRINAKRFTDNVIDLMAGKLDRLPERTQKAMRLFACLGNTAETASLVLIHGESEEALHTALWEALRAGLVSRLDTTYAFIHDRVQEAAYHLIPTDEQAEVHLKIGRILSSQTATHEIREKIFEIVNQFNRGTALIHSAEERDQVAEFNLMAGKRAKTSAAYASALTYLAAGRALLGATTWERQYRLTFDLEFHRAECEILTGDLVAAEERLAMLSRRAENLVDSAAVACLRADLYTNLDRAERAVEIGLEYLRLVGVTWSVHPTDEEVSEEYARIWRQLGSRSVEDLLELPSMTDTDCRVTLDVLTSVHAPANFIDGNLVSLVIGRMANLSLEHGNAAGSCFAYVYLGMILESRFGDYRRGLRFGKLGVNLLERDGLDRFRARVYNNFGMAINPWANHVRTSVELLRRANDTAREAGDLTFMGYSYTNLISALLIAGDPLSDVQRESETALAFLQRAQFGTVADMVLAQLSLIRALRGLTGDISTFNHAEFDESQFELHLEDPALAMPACWYWIRKMQACYLAAAHTSAVAAATRAEALLWTSPNFIVMADYHFYAALLRLAQYDEASADERHSILTIIETHRKMLAVWKTNCPETFSNRAALVEAEIARIEGRELDAERLYEEAIRSAREYGFVQNEGLTNELAGRFYAARGFEKIAHAYLQDARYCYLRWGADGKVKQLERSHPQLREDLVTPSATATMGAPVRQMDVETVVKASQALSSEILLPMLIERLMRITVEHAGAERGLLILLRGDEPQIEAEAITGQDGVVVNVRQAGVTSSDLPQSALHYVIRTRERVVLDDASISSSYSEDAYVLQNRPRSVLCLPIVQQTKLVGALYLENNLTPGAFTSDRVAVLELLASQAAISLENARLYSDLQRSEAFLAEGQSISSTGSFGWNAKSGEILWSEETYQIFACDRAAKPTLEFVLQRTHPDDRAFLQETIDRAAKERTNFDFEHRLLMPDGAVKHLHVIAHFLQNSSDNLEFVGAVMDVTSTKQAEEALRKAQADLAHVSRVTTMGELVASIAHEVNQPLGAIVTNGQACVRLLSRDLPDLDKSLEVIGRMINDGMRASEVIKRIRDLLQKSPPEKAQLNINETVQEVIELVSSDVLRSKVELRAELAADLPPVTGDRIQLQQVVLNLILNARDAMSEVSTHPRELLITTLRNNSGDVVVAVKDSGKGLDAKDAERIFDPFFTTKAEGMGLGLSISRTIVEAHGGTLWAMPNGDEGATIQFSLPPRIAQSAGAQFLSRP